jgi:hypothetical protein
MLSLSFKLTLLIIKRPSNTSRPSSDDKWQHDLFANKPRDGRDRQPASDAPTQKLLVEGLHYEITTPELEVRIA